MESGLTGASAATVFPSLARSRARLAGHRSFSFPVPLRSAATGPLSSYAGPVARRVVVNLQVSTCAQE